MIYGEHSSADRWEPFGHDGIYLIYFVEQFFVVLAKYFFSVGIDTNKRFVHVSGDDAHILGWTPCVRIGIEMMVVYIGIVVLVRTWKYIDTFGSIEYFHIRIVLFQFIHPSKFEAYVPDFEIGDTFAQMNQMRRRGIVGLGVTAGRNDTVNIEPVSCNFFSKIFLRLYSYRDNFLLFVSSSTCYCNKY